MHVAIWGNSQLFLSQLKLYLLISMISIHLLRHLQVDYKSRFKRCIPKDSTKVLVMWNCQKVWNWKTEQHLHCLLVWVGKKLALSGYVDHEGETRKILYYSWTILSTAGQIPKYQFNFGFAQKAQWIDAKTNAHHVRKRWNPWTLNIWIYTGKKINVEGRQNNQT